jgi:hypothetical protein
VLKKVQCGQRFSADDCAFFHVGEKEAAISSAVGHADILTAAVEAALSITEEP